MTETDTEFVEREWDAYLHDPDYDLDSDILERLFALARRGAAMQTLGAHEFDPDPFFPTHCKCGRRFENNVHDLPPPPKGADDE